MAGEMQTGILNRGLYAFAAFLNGGIWQADYGHPGKSIGVIYFDFDDNAFQTHDGAGKNSSKHEKSVDEEG